MNPMRTRRRSNTSFDGQETNAGRPTWTETGSSIGTVAEPEILSAGGTWTETSGDEEATTDADFGSAFSLANGAGAAIRGDRNLAVGNRKAGRTHGHRRRLVVPAPDSFFSWASVGTSTPLEPRFPVRQFVLRTLDSNHFNLFHVSAVAISRKK